jgi:hypothetical protein
MEAAALAAMRLLEAVLSLDMAFLEVRAHVFTTVHVDARVPPLVMP